MQGVSSSGSLAAGGLYVFAVYGAPIFLWIAIFTIALAMVFLVHVIIKRRREAREAQILREARLVRAVEQTAT
jgi:ABC-type Fe3+-siderophore transport system permease subunit